MLPGLAARVPCTRSRLFHQDVIWNEASTVRRREFRGAVSSLFRCGRQRQL